MGNQAQLLREPTFLTIQQVSIGSGQSVTNRDIRVVIDFYPESDNEGNRLIVYIRAKNGDIVQFEAETDEADKYVETGEITLDPDRIVDADLRETRDNIDMCDEDQVCYPKRELLDRMDRIAVFLDHGVVYS